MNLWYKQFRENRSLRPYSYYHIPVIGCLTYYLLSIIIVDAKTFIIIFAATFSRVTLFNVVANV